MIVVVLVVIIVIIIVVVVEIDCSHGTMSQKLTYVSYNGCFGFSCLFCLIMHESKKVACEDCVCEILER